MHNMIDNMKSEDNKENEDHYETMTYKEYIDKGKQDNAIITNLPYRFGITTSNMSESFNNAIDYL